MVSHFQRFLSHSLLFSLLLLVLVAGCDSPTAPTVAQSVGDIAWRPDGSGMIALVEQVNELDVTTTYQTFDLFSADANGNIGSKLTSNGQAGLGYFPGIFLTPDGSSAIVQLGSNISRVSLKGGGTTILLLNTNLLLVSPDAKYMLVTDASTAVLSKLCVLYDISGTQPRRVTQFIGVNQNNGRGLWLENGLFALTHEDSIGFNVKIYDTTGTLQHSIPNAEVPFHASAFAPQAHQLFVRTNDENIDRIDLSSNWQRSGVLGGQVLSFDVTPDARLAVYSDTSNGYTLHSLNLANGHSSSIANGPISVFLSPAGDRVAYIHDVDIYNTDIKVASVSVPQ